MEDLFPIRDIRNDLRAVTKPWLEKVDNTKDLKPLRRALYTLLLRDVLDHIDHLTQLEAEEQLTGWLWQICSELVTSSVGGRGMREDLLRRLAWIAITIQSNRGRREGKAWSSALDARTAAEIPFPK